MTHSLLVLLTLDSLSRLETRARESSRLEEGGGSSRPSLRYSSYSSGVSVLAIVYFEF